MTVERALGQTTVLLSLSHNSSISPSEGAKSLHGLHAREADTTYWSEGVSGDSSGPSLPLGYSLETERRIQSGLHPQRICGLEKGIL